MRVLRKAWKWIDISCVFHLISRDLSFWGDFPFVLNKACHLSIVMIFTKWFNLQLKPRTFLAGIHLLCVCDMCVHAWRSSFGDYENTAQKRTRKMGLAVFANLVDQLQEKSNVWNRLFLPSNMENVVRNDRELFRFTGGQFFGSSEYTVRNSLWFDRECGAWYRK